MRPERQINFRKLMFVLPNLFTVTSIFCGFYALTLCAGDASPQHLYQAALAIFFAAFFDAFDGRVARLTKTQSDFGVQLDSLADVVSFGGAPALLVYKWALAPLGFAGVFVSFAFAACGALRLARFNVLAQRSSHTPRYFVGLPIPFAALAIVALVIANYGARGAALHAAAQIPVAVLVVLLSLLMVSTVQYRTFKDVRLSPKSIAAFAAICAVAGLVAMKLHPAYVLAAFILLYIAMGLVESAVVLATRLARRRAPAGAPGGGPGEAEEEEDGVDSEDFL